MTKKVLFAVQILITTATTKGFFLSQKYSRHVEVTLETFIFQLLWFLCPAIKVKKTQRNPII